MKVKINASAARKNYLKRAAIAEAAAFSIAYAGVLSAAAPVAGNAQIESFSKAKRLLEREVYADHRVTLYCRAPFDEKKRISLPAGFTTPKHEKRAGRVEWEHVVPAENFGRFFVEWREGDEVCTDSKGRSFKGRKCAEKANKTFRFMQADMYNLYPAIGAVNAMRSNFNFTMLPGVPNTFGTCAMKIEGNRAEPPEYSRGEIARSTLYMAAAYPAFRISAQQRRLMESWNKMYPATEWECTRADRIKKLQKNENPFVVEACRAAKLR